ncbi:hypothetical protein DYB36_011255 [Aphanomyces astaci]|uniref:Uncharacterized protein n=1 Tax=Aphanomyces astaci TaxID=112090 RepID=A0A397BJD2_APHAT|nr:hypothetical protein DYB36_011255 [Aphanomyces astaci]
MLIDRAISSFCSGAYELAFKDANQAMSSSGKKNVSPFAGLGEAFLHRDQYCVALAAFEKGLETNPNDVDCMVGIHDTNESVNVASAFGVPDIWAVLAKDPHTLNLLRAKSFKALIQAVRDHPSQYRRYREVLVNVLAILQKHRQSIGPPTAAPVQPTIPSQPKAVTSKPVTPSEVHIMTAKADSTVFVKLISFRGMQLNELIGNGTTYLHITIVDGLFPEMIRALVHQQTAWAASWCRT